MKKGTTLNLVIKMKGSDFEKRRERLLISVEMMKALIPVYWDTADQYESGMDLLKCLAESAVEHADALIHELDKEDDSNNSATTNIS
ncbi:MAG: hypothetical protein ACRDCI_14155 [Plesiomonas shigelloides]